MNHSGARIIPPFRFSRGTLREIPYNVPYRRRIVFRARCAYKKMPERSDKPIVFPAPQHEVSPQTGVPERRGGVRYPFTAAAEICELRSQARVSGRCSDLSPGGCYVDTLSPFAVGTIVKIRMERDQRTFEGTAAVAYAHVSMGMGLTFTEIKPDHQLVLRAWIAELSGEPVPEPVAGAVVAAVAEETDSGAIEANANIRLVLNELIYLLVRRKIITENEASGLLRQMFR